MRLREYILGLKVEITKTYAVASAFLPNYFVYFALAKVLFFSMAHFFLQKKVSLIVKKIFETS